jgi:hypothetical protein
MMKPLNANRVSGNTAVTFLNKCTLKLSEEGCFLLDGVVFEKRNIDKIIGNSLIYSKIFNKNIEEFDKR